MIGSMALPLGFRFHPTDEELVTYYLRNRVKGIDMDLIASFIPDIDIYKSEPWDLHQHSRLSSSTKDKECFFFSSRDKKYPNGERTNRATEVGFWKVTGRDRTVKKGFKEIIGMRKTLVFYSGRAPNHERTNWIMYEYRLDGDEWESTNVWDGYVLCRVMKKDKFIPRKNNLNHLNEQVDCGDCPSESSCTENEAGTVPVPPSSGASAKWGTFDDFHKNLDSLPYVDGDLPPLRDEEIELDLPPLEEADYYRDSPSESSSWTGPLARPSNASATCGSFADVDWNSLAQIVSLDLQLGDEC